MTNSSKHLRNVPAARRASARAREIDAVSACALHPARGAGPVRRLEPGTLDAEVDAARAPAVLPQHAAAPTAGQQALRPRLAAARQAGYQDGYRDGLVALDSFKQSVATPDAVALGQLLHGFDRADRRAASRRWRRPCARAGRRARAPAWCAPDLQVHPEHVAQSVAQALNAVLSKTRRHIHGARAPGRPCAGGAGAGRDAGRTRRPTAWPTRPSTRGGCLVESDLGQSTRRIETRWSRAVGSLGSELPWDDGRPSAAMTPFEPMPADARAALWSRYLADLQDYAALPQPLEAQRHAGARHRPGARSRRRARAGGLAVRVRDARPARASRRAGRGGGLQRRPRLPHAQRRHCTA